MQSRAFRIVGLKAYPHGISLASNIEWQGNMFNIKTSLSPFGLHLGSRCFSRSTCARALSLARPPPPLFVDRSPGLVLRPILVEVASVRPRGHLTVCPLEAAVGLAGLPPPVSALRASHALVVAKRVSAGTTPPSSVAFGSGLLGCCCRCRAPASVRGSSCPPSPPLPLSCPPSVQKKQTNR